MCNVNESPGNVIYCNLYAWCVFLYGLNFKSMDKHSFFIALWVLCFIPVSLFSRSRVVNDTIFSKKLMQKEHARCIFLHLMEKFREKNYPVLYLFHGMSQTNQDWVCADMCRRWPTV